MIVHYLSDDLGASPTFTSTRVRIFLYERHQDEMTKPTRRSVSRKEEPHCVVPRSPYRLVCNYDRPIKKE
jgi:hypothetical protein